MVRRLRIPFLAPFLISSLVLLLAACGGSDENNGTTDMGSADGSDGGADIGDTGGDGGADTADELPPGQPRWSKPNGHASIVFRVDDSANRTYADGDMEWNGSFSYDARTNIVEFASSWLPDDGPFPPLYDDGPYTTGGHEAEGATAGDGIFEAEVFFLADEETTFEYGLINELDRWIWRGANGQVTVDAGETGTVVAPGIDFPAFGSIDMRVTLDTSTLHADFASVDPALDPVYLKGSMISWQPVQLLDNGQRGDTASGDGIFTFTLSEYLGPHDGLLALGQEAQFVFVFFGAEGSEYKLAGDALTNGVAAFSTWNGSFEPEELLLRSESGSSALNTAIIVGPDEPAGDDPILRFVDPDRGPTTGGTPVELSGEDFQAGATVTFGSAEAECVVQSDRIITCNTPPRGSSGVVPVTVENPDGGSDVHQLGFTYIDVASAPRIDSVTPSEGSELGGTEVTVAGANFSEGASLSFGDTLATTVSVAEGGGSITGTTPAGEPGPVDVTVRNSDGQIATASAGFSYQQEGIDWAAIQWPTNTVSVGVDEPLPALTGVVYEPGVTDAEGQGGGVTAEIIVGPAGTDPSLDFTDWTATTATYDGDEGNNDEYTQGSDIALSEEGEYDWAVRFSLDGGSTWYYGDLDTDNATYDPTASGTIVVSSGLLVSGIDPAAVPLFGPAELTALGSNFTDSTAVLTRLTGGEPGDFAAIGVTFEGSTELTLDLGDATEARPIGPRDLRFDDGEQALVIENAFLVGYVFTPSLDGTLGGGSPNWDAAFLHAESDLETSWTGHELRSLYASFDDDGLYVGLSADIQRGDNNPGNVIVVYVDTDFGTSSGFSDMTAINDEDTDVPVDWWRLDRALTSQIDAADVDGFGADFAFGSFDLVPTDGPNYIDALTGWRQLRAGDNAWYPLDVDCNEGGPCVEGADVDAEAGGALETFVPWTVLYGDGGVPAGGRRIAMFARIVNRTGDFISNQALPEEPDDEDPWNVTDVVILDVR